ncbi:MAG: DEAD/DEAH box helicase [Defluviitaleaceae bacterium]|nr:DEAD/DEAH box helicase [Defluviitaleaceae bacterium]
MPASQTAAITKGTILNISSNADVYERGERYYRDGKLLSFNATEETEGVTTIRASVEGNYKNYEVSLKLDSVGALSGYACSCESHSIWRGACKHVVAVLFAHAEGHARMFSAEKMRQHARNLTNNLEKIIYDGIDESLILPISEDGTSQGALLKLAPVLNCNPKGVFLTFTVGYSRMYVVKSISGFVNSCKSHETVTYGQGLTISHRRELFDEVSCKLIDFITREDAMYAEIGKRLSRQFQFTHHPLFASRELYLTPRNTDEFFEICEGLPLECVSDFGQRVHLRDGYPSFGLTIRHLVTGTVAHSRDFHHRVLRGATSYYILAEGGLYRMPKADGKLLSSFLKALEETPSREILFTGNDQLRFLTVILPRLNKMGVVDSVVGDSPEGEISTLRAKMYFDIEGKDITGRVEFHYENQVIDAFDEEDEEYEISQNEAIRDVVAEYALRRRMASLGFFEDVIGKLYRLRGNDLIYAFLHMQTGIETLRDCAEIFVSEDLQKKTIRAQSPKIGLRLTGNLLKVSLEDSGYDINELLEALEAYRAKKKFFRLKDGRFITLDDEAVTAAAGFLEALDVTKKEVKGKSIALPAYRALYVDELTKANALAETHTLKRDTNFENLLAHFQNNSSLGFRTPKGLSGILREYQKTGYSWLKTLAHYGFGGILADDMGLGKTLQVIALLASERKNGLPSIVVAPTSLLYNWENEIIKFAPQLKTQVISGLPEKRRELLKTRDIDVFITTYDMLKRDVEAYEEMEFVYIIADEAQNIKNPSTQASKSIKELKGRVRFALTGTPIENTLTELWSIFDFIMPGYLYTASKFGRLFETPIIKHNDNEAAAKLRSQIAPFVLRRIKKHVLKELPEKTETTLPAELTTEQKKIYQANLLEAIGAFDDIIAEDSFADNRMRILAQLTRLRQICCHPALFTENYEGGSGKLTLALETIQLALDSGHRVLLFSQFTQMLALIKEALASTEISNMRGEPVTYFYLDGATKAKERMEMTESFNAGECDLFLISLKAGGTGLNLTGADVVIHYDPWWNPSVMEQAADRAHRYGQKKAVQVFNIVAKDSIEEKIMALQEKKRGLIDSVITEGGSFINLLSEDEVRKLFS